MLEDGLKFDKRIIDRNIQRGTLTQEEYDTFMGSLEDVSAKGEMVEITVHDGEFKIEMPEIDEDFEEEE